MSETLPFVSVIVCVYNGASHVERCLLSLQNQTYTNDRYEVIVVDDGSSDGTPDLVRKVVPKARLIRHNINRGLAAARNTGVSIALGQIICFTDVDCAAEPNWIAEIVNFFLLHPDVHAIGGPVVASGGKTLWENWYSYTPGSAGSHKPLYTSSAAAPLHLLGLVRGRLPVCGEELAVIQGANSAFRRQVITALGGWHPAIRFGGDDVEFSGRLLAAGFKQIYITTAIVHHYHRSTAKAFMRHALMYGLGGGRVRYLFHQGNLAGAMLFPIRLLPFLLLVVFTKEPAYLLLAPLFLLFITLPRSWTFTRREKKLWLILGLPMADLFWRFFHWLGLLAAVIERRNSKRSQFWKDVTLYSSDTLK